MGWHVRRARPRRRHRRVRRCDGRDIGGQGLGERSDGLGDSGDATSIGYGDELTGTRGGSPGPDGPGKTLRDLTPRAHDPVLIGGLPREAVDRVIREHLPAIRYCYQRALQSDPDLAGRVRIAFTIGADGSVSRATPRDDTLADPSVAQCIRERVYTMRFPEPRGGGVVLVTYPFLFGPG